MSLACAALCACDRSNDLGAASTVVARAGTHEIGVADFGEIIARGSYVPLDPDVIERMVGLWVDYSLVAQRLAEGDSLTDSATVLRTMWDDAELQVISHYHDALVSERVVLSAAMIDSAYNAGDHRLIYHILVNAPGGGEPALRARQRRKAERLRALAVNGPTGWSLANGENEDSIAREVDGSFGLIERGETLPEFDRAAFGLQPGQVSPVVESDLGFHILRRPALDEARSQFTAELQGLFIRRMNVEFVDELEHRWEVEVEPGAVDLMRIAVGVPNSDDGDRAVLGEYRSGRFTVADLRRWLKALPVEYTAEARDWDDTQLMGFLRGLIRNEVLEVEAREAGYELTDDDFTLLRDAMVVEIDRIRTVLGLDTLLQDVRSQEDRYSMATAAVDGYLEALTNDLTLLVPIPPFLAELLREEAEWGVSRSAVDRALAHGARLRVLMESAERGETVQNPDSSGVTEENDDA